MNALIDAAISRARLTLAALVLILIMGWIAWQDIPKESNPDVQIPIIYVSLVHEGISPEDAERLLVMPMEQELRAIEGIKEMRSTAREGGGNVLLEFEAGFDADQALADVRAQVDIAKKDLPDDAKEPAVHEINLSLFPVLVVTLAGDVPERTLQRLARDLRDKVEMIPSVLEARILGQRDELVEIVIDPVLVESYGLSPATIVDLIRRSNQIIAAGALETGQGRFAIKVPGLYDDLVDILDTPIAVSGDATVKVRDIAAVRRGFKDHDSLARINGRPGLVIEVSKRSGEHIIETIEQVRSVVEGERRFWPPGLEVGYSQDESAHIRNMLADLQNNLLIAVILVLVVVLALLGWRTTTLVAVAVPGSFLAGILMLAGMDLTVNVVVLFGLIFAAGNVVDGAIVVTEYADTKMVEGVPRREAYALAAKRMAWPITASTATQLAAFLPLLFWPGVVGEFMLFLPITQFVTLFAALAMALVFVPALGALFGRPGGGSATVDAVSAIKLGEIKRQRGFTGGYVRLLDRALSHPGKVLIAAVMLLAAVTWAYAVYGRGVEFFPKIEPDRAVVQVHARGNLAVAEQDRLVGEVESRILALAVERGEMSSIYTQAGRGAGQVRDEAEDVIGNIQLEFADWRMRRKADEILADIQARTTDLAGIVVEAQRERAGPPVGKPVQIEVAARDPAKLAAAAATLAQYLATVQGLAAIEDTRALPGIQWSLEVDRAQAAKFGADVSLVGQMLKLVTKGLKLGEYRPDDADDEIDIVARYPGRARTISELDRIRVQTAMGQVPLSNFVSRIAEPRTGTLYRTDGRRVITVKADIAPGVLADAKVQEVQAWLEANPLDPSIGVRFKGEDEEQRKAQAFVSKAFLAALCLIFLILLAQFNSFFQTLLILSAVVLSTFGVMIGLLVASQPFGIIMSGIGVVALAGIVVANNIVLIDTFNLVRQSARDAREAILITGAERLRPVLLTALNNVLGLMPMMFGANIDFLIREVTIGAPSAQWWTQLSQAIVYGLGFATVLTLILTPCALMLEANLARWRQRRRFARMRPETHAEPADMAEAAE